MSEYTPTTAHVREVFSNRPGCYYVKQQAVFDRWLILHDAATRRIALTEAAGIADSSGHHWSGQPATACFDVAEAIRAEAEL